VNETRTPTAGTSPPKVYERCDQCSAPVDEGQRYCVVCGTRNKRAADPVARYLAVATSRSRAANSSRPPGARRRRPAGLGTAAVIAVIPLAVALGVIVGRTGSGGDAQLIAALKAQKPPVVTVTGGAAAASSGPAAATISPLTSTFSLHQGYAVELETLPATTATPAAITQAERAAGAKGATAVGVIAGHDFTITPKPAAGDVILYAGQYKTRSAATAALAKLKRRFPGALVIAVRPLKAAATASTGGQVNATATKSQLAQGGQAVKKISHATGSGYVQAQNNLPGVVSVP
jgi:hypothetical protein